MRNICELVSFWNVLFTDNGGIMHHGLQQQESSDDSNHSALVLLLQDMLEVTTQDIMEGR